MDEIDQLIRDVDAAQRSDVAAAAPALLASTSPVVQQSLESWWACSKVLQPRLKDGIAKAAIFETLSIMVQCARDLQEIVSDKKLRMRDRMAAAKLASEITASIANLSRSLEPVIFATPQDGVARNKPPPQGPIILAGQVQLQDRPKPIDV